VKHWQETKRILDRLAELTAAGQGAAIACVVRISGSAYRRPGARFLIAADGSTLGGISGGCLEEDVRQTGLGVIETGECRMLHYETGNDDEAIWGLGLGCDGTVDIFVVSAARLGYPKVLNQLRKMLDGNSPFAVITIIGNTSSANGAEFDNRIVVLKTGPDQPKCTGIDEEFLALVRVAAKNGVSHTIEAKGMCAFVELFEPPPYLVICGASDDAIPMVRSAADAGFRVVVLDHRPAYLASERFPTAWQLIETLPGDDAEIPATADTFVVLKTHNLTRDKEWARRFLATPVPYLGLLGPQARCEEIVQEATEHDRKRIFGPVGLDLGAEGPEQVGLSVVSELLAVRSGRSPNHLKNRDAPIHDPA